MPAETGEGTHDFAIRLAWAPGSEIAAGAGSRRPRQAESDRIQAHQHQQEVLRQSFTRWVLAFSLILCTMLPTMLVLFVWLLVSLVREVKADCDVPLRWWVLFVCVNVAYHTNICGVGSVHHLVLKNLCRFDPDADAGGSAPSYVKVYNLAVTLTVFVWHCIGLHWVVVSRTCKATSPDLFESVKVFSSFSIAFNLFVYVNTVGLYTIMMFMLRNGLLHTSNAAPEGSLEMQKVVQYDEVCSKDDQECCICMAEFDQHTEIRRTICGHCFHGKCLGGWLKVNHTCPLCRADLTCFPRAVAVGSVPALMEEDPEINPV